MQSPTDACCVLYSLLSLVSGAGWFHLILISPVHMPTDACCVHLYSLFSQAFYTEWVQCILIAAQDSTWQRSVYKTNAHLLHENDSINFSIRWIRKRNNLRHRSYWNKQIVESCWQVHWWKWLVWLRMNRVGVNVLGVWWWYTGVYWYTLSESEIQSHMLCKFICFMVVLW